MGSKITNASGGALTLYKDAASNTINSSDLYNKVVDLKGKGRFLLAQGYYGSGSPLCASCMVSIDTFCSGYESMSSGSIMHLKMPNQGNYDLTFDIKKNGKITCDYSNINLYLV